MVDRKELKPINSFIICYIFGRHSREGGNPIYPRMDARLRTSGMTDKAMKYKRGYNATYHFITC
jgi:hypothetical protein